MRFWCRTRKQGIASNNAAENAEQIVLDKKGYSVEHQGETTTVSWSNVLGVTTTDDALLIVLSPKHYYPIETRAFEDIEQVAATAAKIQEWIEAAESD